jgi:predicted unusual protein kinase regulating ubiquinone biosynthesis (AarF/ABC1/UbiB family)
MGRRRPESLLPASLDARDRRREVQLLPQPLLAARRNAHFFMRAGFLFLSYKSFALRTNLFVRSPEAVEKEWATQHEWGGAQLYKMAVDLQGFHLKGAQWLSARPDICPPEWVSHLSRLQDQCPPLERAEVEEVVRSEFGLSVDEAFASFDDTPIGSASIAQVHRARLHPEGGWARPWRRCRPVAVKVQRPGAEARMTRDLRNIRGFFSLPVVRSSLAWDPVVILDQVDGEIQEEFNFVGEALAMDAVSDVLRRPLPGPLRWLRRAAFYRPPVLVPRSVTGMVTKRLLVMDLIPGVQLSRLVREAGATGAAAAARSDVPAGRKAAGQGMTETPTSDAAASAAAAALTGPPATPPRAGESMAAATALPPLKSGPMDRRRKRASQRLLRKLGEAYGRMLFEDGFGGVHADPHPGNLVLSPGLGGARIGLVDFGQTKSYDLSMRLRLARMVEALCAAGDASGRAASDDVLEAFRGLGIRWNSTRPLEEQRAAVGATATEWYDTTRMPKPYSPDPTSKDYPVLVLQDLTAFPVELVYFFRATQYLRAMGGYLGVEWSLAEVWRPHARRLIRRHGRDPGAWAFTITGLGERQMGDGIDLRAPAA